MPGNYRRVLTETTHLSLQLSCQNQVLGITLIITREAVLSSPIYESDLYKGMGYSAYGENQAGNFAGVT